MRSWVAGTTLSLAYGFLAAVLSICIPYFPYTASLPARALSWYLCLAPLLIALHKCVRNAKVVLYGFICGCGAFSMFWAALFYGTSGDLRASADSFVVIAFGALAMLAVYRLFLPLLRKT
jgi:hypothetical protein